MAETTQRETKSHETHLKKAEITKTNRKLIQKGMKLHETHLKKAEITKINKKLIRKGMKSHETTGIYLKRLGSQELTRIFI